MRFNNHFKPHCYYQIEIKWPNTGMYLYTLITRESIPRDIAFVQNCNLHLDRVIAGESNS